MAILSGPVTLYLRSDDDTKSDEGGTVSRYNDWSAAGVFASLVETVANLDAQLCALCAAALGCIFAALFYIKRSAGGTKHNTSNAASGALPVVAEAVAVLDCTKSEGKRRAWPSVFAKNKLIYHIEVDNVGDLVNLSASLEQALPQGDTEVGAVVVIEPWSLFKASQVSSIDQIGVSRYLENTVRGLRRFADSHGVTADHDAPIPVLGCSAEYGLLQLSRSSCCGFFPPAWVHTEDDTLLDGNRPVPEAARVAMQEVADAWRRDQEVSKAKEEKEAKQAIKREEKKTKKMQ